VTQAPRLFDRIAIWIAALGVLLSAGAWVFGGASMGMSALVGAVVALANWVALRWIGAKLVRAAGAKKAGVLLLLVKMMALVGISGALLMFEVVEPLGFLIGLGGLVVGASIGGLGESLAAAEQEAREQKEEPDAAR
jgi:hypothetical protein